MKETTRKAIRATEKHFHDASNNSKDIPHALDATATGLFCLTGIIEDLFTEIKSLRDEVKSLSRIIDKDE